MLRIATTHIVRIRFREIIYRTWFFGVCRILTTIGVLPNFNHAQIQVQDFPCSRPQLDAGPNLSRLGWRLVYIQVKEFVQVQMAKSQNQTSELTLARYVSFA
jgi:hypothetical protein